MFEIVTLNVLFLFQVVTTVTSIPNICLSVESTFQLVNGVAPFLGSICEPVNSISISFKVTFNNSDVISDSSKTFDVTSTFKFVYLWICISFTQLRISYFTMLLSYSIVILPGGGAWPKKASGKGTFFHASKVSLRFGKIIFWSL